MISQQIDRCHQSLSLSSASFFSRLHFFLLAHNSNNKNIYVRRPSTVEQTAALQLSRAASKEIERMQGSERGFSARDFKGRCYLFCALGGHARARVFFFPLSLSLFNARARVFNFSIINHALSFLSDPFEKHRYEANLKRRAIWRTARPFRNP